MKKALYILFFVLALLITYDASSPNLTITEINLGITSHDPEKLSEYIDFPVLRQNLKNQRNSIVIRNIAEINDDPSSLFAAGISSAILENRVDFFITPTGLASMLSNKFKSKNHTCDISETSAKDCLFQSARLQLNSSDTFSVLVPYGIKKEFRLILQRDILRWKLVDIVFSNPNLQ